jgi:glycerophosphoryl diester phosphodiesterase
MLLGSQLAVLSVPPRTLAAMELLRSVTGRVTVSAHRGASGYAPENTMAAFRLAAELGADAVELDVHLTADDRLVVVHDDTLDRTTAGRGYVRDHTCAEVSNLAADATFGEAFAAERVPLLENVLRWAGEANMPLAIELKRPNEALGREPYPELARLVLEQVFVAGVADQVVLFSDDHALVREVHQLAPEVTTGIALGLATFIDPVGLAREAGANGIYVYWRYASRRFVEACHTADLHVFGFGLGDDLTRTVELRAMLANGTDFVSSGKPDLLRAFVDGCAPRTFDE